jgi:hypothetical protein
MISPGPLSGQETRESRHRLGRESGKWDLMRVDGPGAIKRSAENRVDTACCAASAPASQPCRIVALSRLLNPTAATARNRG